MNQFSLIHAVREPAGNTPEPAPLLLLLHGVGSNEEDLMGLAPALDPRFFIVSARAPITLGHRAYGWYHVQFTSTGHIIDFEEAEQSRKILLRFVDELIRSYNIDARRVYLMGFSQGCIMSLAAALTEPGKFAGVAGMSGRMPPGIDDKIAPPNELNGLPILIVHGMYDSVISIELGRGIRDALEKLPVELTYREYPIGHHVSEESLNDVTTWLAGQLDAPDWRAKSVLSSDE
jgi:phospholipase/carboxylesterase